MPRKHSNIMLCGCASEENYNFKFHKMTAVGFEPTPLRTGAWSQRLRPLGQTVLEVHRTPRVGVRACSV